MARGINKVILVGNLGADPETRYSAAGAPIVSIRIATSDSWRDKQTGEMQERTEWHRVKFFGRLAEIAGEYLRKGSQVYVEGALRTDKYTGQDGVERYSTDIIGNEMQMLGSRSGGEGGGRGGEGGGRGGSAGGGAQEARGGAEEGQTGSAAAGRGRDPFESRGGAGYDTQRGGTERATPTETPAAPLDGFEDDNLPF